MTLELSSLPWFLLGALVLFAAGWIAARIDLRQLLHESRTLPQSYFKGLNFLVNEEQDKAVEAFIEATQANPEAIELQFALGSLFRRRGEVDRAIRIHQSLSERGNLPAEQRTAALLELAMDYQKAGLLDHAERILVDVSNLAGGGAGQQTQAMRLLLDIYVQEKDWAKAIAAAKRIDVRDERGKHDFALEIAHFHCELAADEYLHGRHAAAEKYLDAALAVAPTCVRVHLMRGEWQAAAGQHESAINSWLAIEKMDPTYLGLMAERMLASYEQLSRGDEGLDHLRELQRQYPGLDLLNALFQAVLRRRGPQAAYEMIKQELHVQPTLVGLDRMLEAQLLAADEDKKAELQMLKSLVHSHASRLAVYLCKQCGFRARQFYWHCPACGGWDSFPPRRTAEYDSADRHLARLHIEGVA